MYKQDIINRLQKLPEEIEAFENNVIEAVNKIREAKEALTAKEDMLLVGGTIDGKNAETRSAQIRSHTVTERQTVQAAENTLSIIRAYLNRLNNEQANDRAIADMLKGVI